MTGSSTRLPKIISGPLVNSPIEPGPDKADIDKRKKRGKNNSAKRSKKPKQQNETGQVQFREPVCSNNLVETELEMLEEAKMKTMEQFFRKQRGQRAVSSEDKPTARAARGTTATCLTNRRTASTKSRERLYSLIPGQEDAKVLVDQDLLTSATVELDHLRRLQDKTYTLSHRRQSDLSGDVMTSGGNKTNNSVTMATRRRVSLAEWMRSKFVDNSEINKKQN